MTAATMDGFATQNRKFLIVSAIGHVLLLLVAGSNLLKIPRQPMTRLAIEAVVVDQSEVKRTTEADRRKAEQAAQRKREEAAQQRRREQEQQEQQARDKKAAEQRKQQASDRSRAEQQRKDKESKAAAEQQRKKSEAERKQRAQREAEAQAKAQREKEAAAARAKAEAEQREQARRQAELMAAMEAEEGLMAAAQSGELSRYLALIQQKVERNWVPPATVQEGLECEVAVVQLPNGDVVDARTVSCNGDAAVQRSIENAVRRSSPLPLPDNRALFERNLRFIFKPQQ